MPSTSIGVKVDYTPAVPPASPPATADDKIDNSGNSSLSGSGDSSGASTDATEPNGDGGTDNRQRKSPVPNGATFKSATVTITMTCDDAAKTVLTLIETGNVSASAKVEGNCITTSTVNRTTTGLVTETKTVTKKKCCPGASVVVLAVRQELDAFKQEIRGLLRSQAETPIKPMG